MKARGRSATGARASITAATLLLWGSLLAPAARADELPPAQLQALSPPEPRPISGLTQLAIVTAGFAVIAAGDGTGLVLSVGSDFDAKKTTCAQRQCTADDIADMRLRLDVGRALWVAGGALLALDLVLWIVDAVPGKSPAKSKALAHLVPTGDGLAFGASF